MPKPNSNSTDKSRITTGTSTKAPPKRPPARAMFVTLPPDLDALKARFRNEAQRQGLIDVAYAIVDSPLGSLLVVSTKKGVLRIAFDNQSHDSVLEAVSVQVSPRVLEAPKRLDPVRRELDEYFRGSRRGFQLPLDLRVGPFQAAVLRALMRVPYGDVETYGSLAKKVGRPQAARAVGGALNRNPIPIVVPCHRVIGASGALVGYAGGVVRKQALLEHESPESSFSLAAA
jgi:methylated-DNA-[protein]-cysteine S-methyltransferase